MNNPLSANPTKWSNTLKQFVGKLPTNCLGAFDHFVKLALKGLIFLSRPQQSAMGFIQKYYEVHKVWFLSRKNE